MLTNTVKLEVQNDGMDLIKDHDALKRKGGKGKKKKGKQQKVVQVAMTRYQGRRQKGKVLPGGDVIVLCYFIVIAELIQYVIWFIARSTPQGDIYKGSSNH